MPGSMSAFRANFRDRKSPFLRGGIPPRWQPNAPAPGLIKSVNPMLKNYLIVAWRNIKRNKAYSALNVLGLAVGLAVFILIMLFVRTEVELRPLSRQRREHLPGGPGAAGQRLSRLQRLRRHARPAGRGHGPGLPRGPEGDPHRRLVERPRQRGGQELPGEERPLDRPPDLRDLLLPDRPRRPVRGPRGPVLGPPVGAGGPPLLRRTPTRSAGRSCFSSTR